MHPTVLWYVSSRAAIQTLLNTCPSLLFERLRHSFINFKAITYNKDALFDADRSTQLNHLTHVPLQEGKCPPGLKLCCHLFKKNQKGDEAITADTRQDTHVEDGDIVLFSRVTADGLQNGTQQLLEPPPHSVPQSEGSPTEAEMIRSTVHYPCLAKEKETCASHETVLLKAQLQPTQQGVAAAQHRILHSEDIDNNGHELSAAFEEGSQEKQTTGESADAVQKENLEDYEADLLLDADFELYEAVDPIRGTTPSGTPPPAVVDKTDVTVEGNRRTDEHERKATQDGFKYHPETLKQNDQPSTHETAKQFIKYNEDNIYACESLHVNDNLEEFDGAGCTIHTSIKTRSLQHTFSNSDQDSKSDDGDHPVASKSNTLYPQPNGMRNQRHLSVLKNEPSASLPGGRKKGSDPGRKHNDDRYRPVALHPEAERQASPVFSSFLFQKGVGFSIFFWVYLAAFVFAMCCIMSSVITPFSTLGVIIKAVLVYYFPFIIQLEVFRALDYILTFIYKTFT